jgi:hypothetical protein
MAKMTMKKSLVKPVVTQEDTVNWTSLHKRAVNRALKNGLDNDPRLKFLQGTQEDPEKALRRLSILSEADLDREFGKAQ